MKFPVEQLRVTGPENLLGGLKLVLDDVLETANAANAELVADGAAEALTAIVELGEREGE
jgi:hypothetical protein